MCVNKEQPHSHQAIKEHGHEIDPIQDTDGVTDLLRALTPWMEHI